MPISVKKNFDKANDNNAAYRKIRWALQLTDADVVLIMQSAGVEVSKALVDGWNRSRLPRMRVMDNEAFRRFCVGISRLHHAETDTFKLNALRQRAEESEPGGIERGS